MRVENSQDWPLGFYLAIRRRSCRKFGAAGFRFIFSSDRFGGMPRCAVRMILLVWLSIVLSNLEGPRVRPRKTWTHEELRWVRLRTAGAYCYSALVVRSERAGPESACGPQKPEQPEYGIQPRFFVHFESAIRIVPAARSQKLPTHPDIRIHQKMSIMEMDKKHMRHQTDVFSEKGSASPNFFKWPRHRAFHVFKIVSLSR